MASVKDRPLDAQMHPTISSPANVQNCQRSCTPWQDGPSHSGLGHSMLCEWNAEFNANIGMHIFWLPEHKTWGNNYWAREYTSEIVTHPWLRVSTRGHSLFRALLSLTKILGYGSLSEIISSLPLAFGKHLKNFIVLILYLWYRGGW